MINGTNLGIRVQMFTEPRPAELVVNQLASVKDPLDVYCWYEGTHCLPKTGALFLKERLFEPLHRLKNDAKLCLYSLKSWDFKKTTSTIPATTPVGEAINRIHSTAIECIFSASFFQYCIKERGVQQFVKNELSKKEWLFELSNKHRKTGTTVGAFFDNQPSLFDCIKDLDISFAYSLMQYIEGYFLVRESVKRGLLKGQKKIEIAFVLPNDESKYYRDMPKDLEKMLLLDFPNELAGIEIGVSFLFFQYGDSKNARPYIDKQKTCAKVEPDEISSYFAYLQQDSDEDIPKMPFLRDVIHNLNGYN